MLSYRHAFHAGNHADVLKHFVLIELLRYFNRKDKPWWYIDTHAGAGCYALDSEQAGKTAEFAGGIGRLWGRDDLPEALRAYIDAVAQFNPHGRLTFYPGSPALAMTQLREQDRMRLFELHPADVSLLEQTFARDTDRVLIRKADGFAGLRGLLPPAARRAVVLIDPPYEVKEDYRRVVDTVADAMKRFPAGTYAVWYPMLARPEARQLPERLADLGAESWLDVRLALRKPARDGFGMFGSGLYIVNPPWVLPQTLEAVMPWLVRALGEDEDAGFDLEHHIE
ncbi:MAG: 23S rRNA (adenine2030-N6)-methyltransferase [Azoarcus sp.]|uniref:Ribosomal RNA large subunit methyltransferase J n=1 Tax=Aromatoleum tolulyticum TaxID=34027 RepID=A0A1N6PWN8_9RHOO|nr:23S rRNA (adenine(2030)-N(6))-methyltransferase RlmJ [Aromatoleum tolulyticum]MCK9987989.1 23S rRNA (adenine2030-N6)-methyltransferase [Azoarcus sp.]SIQ08750.1 23S rRNA (adenine2030-N6)-methyltransferase [Aromatoleum tolulyticum]